MSYPKTTHVFLLLKGPLALTRLLMTLGDTGSKEEGDCLIDTNKDKTEILEIRQFSCQQRK